MTKVSVSVYSLDVPVERTVFKECRSCKEFTNNFYKHSSRADGLQDICKSCKNAVDKAYRENNKEKCKQKSARYYRANSESIKERAKSYHRDNWEKIREYKKEYYKKNKKAFSEYNKNRAAIDPLFRAKTSARKLIIKALNGHSKSASTQEILGCTYEEFKIHIESQFEPWMNWGNKGLYNGDFNYGWDIDHIVPLSSAKSPEEILSLNHHTNLRPLCSHVNRNIKRDKHEYTT